MALPPVFSSAGEKIKGHSQCGNDQDARLKNGAGRYQILIRCVFPILGQVIFARPPKIFDIVALVLQDARTWQTH